MNAPNDRAFICHNLSALLGIPIGVYEGDRRVEYYSAVSADPDPLSYVWADVAAVEEQVGYVSWSDDCYAGIVNTPTHRIVLGPAIVSADLQPIKRLAFDWHVPTANTKDFVSAMQSIVPLSLESVVNAACLLDHLFNGGNRTLAEVILESAPQPVETPPQADSVDTHNTLDTERWMCGLIESGDVEGLMAMAKQAPNVTTAKIAPTQLGHMRNIFVVAATVASRAAIKGGVPPQEALSMSDDSIRQSESVPSAVQLHNLQYRMILSFARRVAEYRGAHASTKLTTQAVAYVWEHLEDGVSVDEMARALGVSRPYLSGRFAKDTGKSISEYVLALRITRACQALREGDEPLSALAERLGFCSQSHFCRVFREQVGVTPARYREGRDKS